jgi:hypothetical protein
MTTVTATSSTRFVDSADGTAIAYDVTGTGPAVAGVVRGESPEDPPPGDATGRASLRAPPGRPRRPG